MTTEIRIGTNLKNDFFKILIDIIVTTTTNAIIKLSLSKVLLLYPAMLNATGLSLSPYNHLLLVLQLLVERMILFFQLQILKT